MRIFSFLRRSNSTTSLARWWRSRDGNVGMIFALAAIPLVLAAGIGVDMARAYAMRVRLGAALDAAALAVGSTNPIAFTQAQLQTRMQNYFNANYPSNALGTPTVPVMTYQGTGNNVINLTATATIPTTFMRIINVKNMTVNVSNQVTRGVTGLEVALVLDNTGSMMCGDGYPSNCSESVPPSHMDTLRTDAKNIVDTLFAATADPTKLAISVVPYVTSVNVGPALSQGSLLGTYVPTVNGAYVDYNGNKILDAFGNAITYDSSQSPTSLEWIGCVVEPTAANEDTTGIGPDITEPSGGWIGPWTPYWWQSGSGADGTAPSHGSNYTQNQGFASNSNGVYYNTWNIPTTSSKGVVTQHPSAQYVEVDNGDYSNDTNGAIYQSYGPNLGCPTPLVRLTNSQTTLDADVQAMKSRANSGTAITVGMVWGWRTLSPNPPFGDGVPYKTPGWIKAIVLETDGNAEVLGPPNGADYTGYGYINSLTGDQKLGSSTAGLYPPNVTSPTPGTANYYLENRLTTLCNNIKAAGIIVYTIGLGPTGETNKQLQNCAGPAPGAFYPAPTSASLSTAFQEVANSLNQLRLSK